MNPPRLSVVVPFLNEMDSLPLLRRGLESASLPRELELILVSDGSTDGSVAYVEEWAAADPRVKLVELTRNFGHQPAIRAGLDAASGDSVAVMDADLQDTPEDLARMYQEKVRGGWDAVYGVRASRDAGLVMKAAYKAYYALYRALSDGPVSPDSGDFCVMSRRFVEELKGFPERVQYLRGLRSWMGFRSHGMALARPERQAGRTNYTLGRLFGLAANGIVAFSAKPLRLSALLGAFLCLIAASLACFYGVLWLAYDVHAKSPGFTTIVILLLFLSGAQFLMIGILGEYLRQIFLEVKGRPIYLVSRTIGLPAPRPGRFDCPAGG